MSPASYQTAPSRDNKIKYGGGKGIRTPAPLTRPSGFQDRSLQPDLGIPPFAFLQRQVDYSIIIFVMSIKMRIFLKKYLFLTY